MAALLPVAIMVCALKSHTLILDPPKDSGELFKDRVCGTSLFLLLLGVVFYPIYIQLIEIKIVRSLEGEFIECKWCRSYFSHEIWKYIARFLKKNNIPFEIKYRRDGDCLSALIPFVLKFNLDQKKFFSKWDLTSPLVALILPNDNIGIGLFKYTHRGAVWIYVGETILRGHGQIDKDFLVSLT